MAINRSSFLKWFLLLVFFPLSDFVFESDWKLKRVNSCRGPTFIVCFHCEFFFSSASSFARLNSRNYYERLLLYSIYDHVQVTMCSTCSLHAWIVFLRFISSFFFAIPKQKYRENLFQFNLCFVLICKHNSMWLFFSHAKHNNLNIQMQQWNAIDIFWLSIPENLLISIMNRGLFGCFF